MTPRSFAANLIQLREKSQLSRADVARQLGVDLSSVSHWETAKSLPRLPTMVRLAQLYGVDVSVLWTVERRKRAKSAAAKAGG